MTIDVARLSWGDCVGMQLSLPSNNAELSMVRCHIAAAPSFNAPTHSTLAVSPF